MDKTEGIKQNISPSETPSASETGTTPEVQAKTYTQEEFDKGIQSDRIARGRDAKSFELRDKALADKEERIKAAEAEIAKQEKEREDAEFEAIRNNPEAVDWFNKKKALKEERAAHQKDRDALAKDKAEHAAEIEAARETKLEIEIWRIADSEGVDPMELKDTMEDLNLTTVEQAKGLAKRLAKKPQADAKPLSPDSGATSGGKESLKGTAALADYFRGEKK